MDFGVWLDLNANLSYTIYYFNINENKWRTLLFSIKLDDEMYLQIRNKNFAKQNHIDQKSLENIN